MKNSTRIILSLMAFSSSVVLRADFSCPEESMISGMNYENMSQAELDFYENNCGLTVNPETGLFQVTGTPITPRKKSSKVAFRAPGINSTQPTNY